MIFLFQQIQTAYLNILFTILILVITKETLYDPLGAECVPGMSVKLWHNCGKPQFVVVFSQKLCCGCGCGVQFPKIVVGVGVVVDKI